MQEIEERRLSQIRRERLASEGMIREVAGVVDSWSRVSTLFCNPPDSSKVVTRTTFRKLVAFKKKQTMFVRLNIF